MSDDPQLRSSDKTDPVPRNALELSVPTPCCGNRIVVLSQGQFDRRNNGKYICPCATFRKTLVEVIAFDKKAKGIV